MKIVKNFWKTWSWQLAAVALVAPELLQVIADNTSLIHFVSEGMKDTIRLAALVAIAVLRPIKQKGIE